MTVTPNIRVAALVIAIAAVGKTCLTLPHPLLMFAGAVYTTSLWLLSAERAQESPSRWAWLGIATTSLMTVIVTSQNEALLAYAPLVLVTSLAIGLRAAAILTVGLVVWSGVTAIWMGDPPVAVAQILLTMSASGVFLFAFAHLVLRERANVARLQRQSVQLAALSALEERRRVAQQIHDGTGHYLSAAILHLEAARLNRDLAPERSTESLLLARDLVADGMREVRRAVHALQDRTDTLEDALEELISTSVSAGIHTTLEQGGQPRRLTPAVEWALYSTAQECLTNVRRHASASAVQLRLDYLENAVELGVCDDGVGADTLIEGTGLLAIRHRAEQHSGHCFWGTTQRGFEVRLRVST